MTEIRLPPGEFLSIFHDAVEMPALDWAAASAAPLAVYLGAQPGSGKSTVARSSAALFGLENFVHIDVDRLRELHPAYLPMVMDAATEKLAPSVVQRDCSLWADMLRDRAVDGRRNLLVESTMRSPGQVRESAVAMRKAGYKSEARILAVHAKSSEVSLRQRFEHEKQILGYGREIPLDYHDLAAAGIVDTVRAIENEMLFDRLVIFDRSGKILFENTLIDGAWEHAPDGARVMEQFREASYDVGEKNSIATLWADVVDMMGRRGAAPADIEAIDVRSDAAKKIAVDALAMWESQWLRIGGSPGVVVDQGAFNGKILYRCEAGIVVQKVGRDPDKIVLHYGTKLSRLPEVGEIVEISYRSGVGKVSERSVEIERGR